MGEPHVAIIGGGTAGLAAAIVAADARARVTVLEKQPRLGGSLWVSGAYMSAANSRIHEAKALRDSPAEHAADVQRIGRGRADPEVLTLITEEAGRTIDWLVSMGVRFADNAPFHHTDHESYGTPRSFEVVAPKEYGSARGRALLDVLAMQAVACSRSPRIGIRLSSNATGLLRNHDGPVTGVLLRDGEELRVDAVILAAGGYGASQALMRRFHTQYSRLLVNGADGADGDGLLLAEAVGGALTHQDLVLPVPGGIEDPAIPGRALRGVIIVRGRPPAVAGDIWVNRSGKRFMAEDISSPDQRERLVAAQPDGMMVVVFDETMRRGLTAEVGAWTREHLGGDAPDARLVQSASSLSGLAGITSLPAEALEATVGAYNQGVCSGWDPLGRQSLPKQLDTPPYHAVVTYPVLGITFAGVRVNARLEVLDGNAFPIPRLYAAGEVIGAGQMQGAGYSPGIMSTAAVTLGRRSASEAVAAARTRLAREKWGGENRKCARRLSPMT